MVLNVHSSSRRSLQHRLQKTTSVGRARKPGPAPIPAQTQPPPGHRATTGQLDPHMRQALQNLDSFACHPPQQNESVPNTTLFSSGVDSGRPSIFALERIAHADTEADSVRAWWILLPRMLLHRAPGTRTLSKPDWRARIQAFQQGEWLTLLTSSARHSSPSRTAPVPPTAQNPTAAPSDRRRRERARHLVHTGELSAARQALTAGPLAPGTSSTLARLRDPDRRPATAYCTDNTHTLRRHPPHLHSTLPLTSL